ncbi:hypothetical protein E3E12_02805 [Formicincola oecophyllae]|uniref:Uncharacterized protein n=1 Tax=Formicincola oecophyllae TaxID=2558361 RepID=A0A4Y6U9R7_9PROT|nr:hypothetical protein [Formicincola oecophyllae]QDH13308.1 hypothetical protein E3E12_02805 [Formicincola oecophyllae]
MTDTTSQAAPPARPHRTPKALEREAERTRRQAEALRANLLRRKAQARAQAALEKPTPMPSGQTAPSGHPS